MLRTCYPIAECLNLPPRFHQDLHEVAGLICFSQELPDLDRSTAFDICGKILGFIMTIICHVYRVYHDLPWLTMHGSSRGGTWWYKDSHTSHDSRKVVSSKGPGVAFDGSPIHCPAPRKFMGAAQVMERGGTVDEQRHEMN